jgi:glyoxylase-like metal-dependent hydrolase (beta-lactamase superfamily II)
VQLSDRIHLIGSGSYGFDLSDPYDCHVYLLDGGSELALVDVGAGMGAGEIVANVRRAGFDPGRVRRLLCTHAHADHAGGAARIRELLPDAEVCISREVAELLETGDEERTSIGVAKRAGIYPPDYHLEPCPVDRELDEGDRIGIGDLTLECIDTPGHSSGHLSFLLDHGGRRSLFGGDVVFHGGTILLQTSTTAVSPRS